MPKGTVPPHFPPNLHLCPGPPHIFLSLFPERLVLMVPRLEESDRFSSFFFYPRPPPSSSQVERGEENQSKSALTASKHVLIPTSKRRKGGRIRLAHSTKKLGIWFRRRRKRRQVPLFGCCALFEHNSNDCGEREKERIPPFDDPQRFGGFFTRCRRLRKKNFSACDIGKNYEKKLSLSLLQTVAERISPPFAPRIFLSHSFAPSHKRARVRKVTFWGV